jgi:hypothetical protein
MNDSVERRTLYAVIEREGLKKGIWARIGAAFQNRDGSWNLKFDLLPTQPGTTIQMRIDQIVNDRLKVKKSGQLAGEAPGVAVWV